MAPGQFVISLDFELHWGVRDHTPLWRNAAALRGTREAIPRLLALFERRGIHATWATVGIVCARTREEALAFAPQPRPAYAEEALDPYPELERAGKDEQEDPLHFGASIVEQIAATPGQELGTHSYSHFYCLERGATAEAFAADLSASQAIGARFGDVTGSIVFPRNQYDDAALASLAAHGTRAFRGNPPAWFWRPRASGEETLVQRLLRLSDAYADVGRAPLARVSRHPSGVVDVPATRFLRPWSRRLGPLEGRRLERVAAELERAAREGGLFHLWWHPENFGLHTDENLAFLELVLDRFEQARSAHGMESLTMAQAAADAA